jgi:NADPH:quinone reductase-like Zn-dependent oxidoreductase
MRAMKAAVFVRPGKLELREKPMPRIGPTDALLKVMTTTICGTDVHILKGEYRVEPGLTIGHEMVGVVESLGTAVTGYTPGDRVYAGRPGNRWSDYPLRSVRALSGWQWVAMWREAHGRLAARKSARRLPGRVREGAARHGQSG